MNIGNKIKAYRESKKITQKEIMQMKQEVCLR